MSWNSSQPGNHPSLMTSPVIIPAVTPMPAVLVTPSVTKTAGTMNPEQFLEIWKNCYQQYHLEQSRELTVRRNVYVSIGVIIGIAMCYCGIVGISVGLLMGMFMFGNPTEANRMTGYVNSMKNIVLPIFKERLRTKLK